MSKSTAIDGILYARMVQAGAASLRLHTQAINNLNVFPIPDGDTGDNMLLTMVGGADAAGCGSESVSDTARRVSDGMLLSARGNSGVILSQIFEGIADGLEGLDEADNQAFASALREGVRRGYNAVMEPAEGTMLTVARRAAEYISAKASPDVKTMMKDCLREAKRALESTPDMLPVLKKAGVVDSGGAGFVYILEGMIQAFDDEGDIRAFGSMEAQQQDIDVTLFTEDSILEYGYCTELLLRLQRCKTDPETFSVEPLTELLKSIGESVVAFKTGSIVKIHIHTMSPDKALAFCQRYGEFLKVKIENMSLQHRDSIPGSLDSPEGTEGGRSPYGIVAVASGEGIQRLFIDGGADIIVEGGNPSAEEFLEAFGRVDADIIFVLPNNGNAVPAAQQAAGMYGASEVRVIESRTIGDGYAALSMISFDSGDVEQMERDMTEAMEGVATAEVSRCVRDTEEVKKGDYIGAAGKRIIAAGSDRLETAYSTVNALNTGQYDICILIRGSGAGEKEAKKLEEYLRQRYPGMEIYVVNGMQEIYDYIVVLE